MLGLLTLTATLSVATTADVTVGISTSGTGTEGTDYVQYLILLSLQVLQQEQHPLHQRMIVFMKEMKLEL